MGMMNVIVILIAIVYLAIIAAGIYLLILIIRALKKYIGTKDAREETRVVRKSLSEALRENRTRCKMTQEFVSEAIGVSRQAVSKWENGTADPSTANLIALAKLYQVSVETLLQGIDSGTDNKKENEK